MPRLYQYYEEQLDRLYEHHPSFSRIFPRSVYPCIAFNFGQVRCWKHRDVLNCPFGMCAITALGQFNSKEGGHLIIWELKLVIEFPHASTILLPSALFTHSNTPVPSGQTRLSITQYCPGGLFRWVDNGFQTEDAFKAADPEGFRRMCARKDLQWEKGLALLSTRDELLCPTH